MKRRSLVLAGTLLAGCRSAWQQHRASVRIAVGGRAALDFIPVYLASALGFFRDEGMAVNLEDVASTSKALQALLGGSTDLAAGGYDAAIQMKIEGKSVTVIAVLERWPPFALVVAPQSAPSVRMIADLKGRMVGVTSPGSSTHRFLNYLLAKNGLSPSDITPVGVGANFSMAAAVRHGKVAAAIAGPLGIALLSKESPPMILADCRTENGAQVTLGTSSLPASSLMVGAEWARSHTAALRKIGNATRRSLGWIQTHSAEDISRSMPHDYKGDDPALYLAAVRDIRPTFSPDGVMAPDGPANMRRFPGVSDQRARTGTIDLFSTYTNQFIQSK